MKKKPMNEKDFEIFNARHPHPLTLRYTFCPSKKELIKLGKTLEKYYTKHCGLKFTDDDDWGYTYPMIIKPKVSYVMGELGIAFLPDYPHLLLEEIKEAYEKLKLFVGDEFLFHEQEEIRQLRVHPFTLFLKEKKEKKENQ